MAYKDIPEGYAVLQLHDGKWYPVTVGSLHGPNYAEQGIFILNTMLNGDPHTTADVCYPTRKDAIARCHMEAKREARRQQSHYEDMAREEELYPDRCDYYWDLIIEMTGEAPMVLTHDIVTVYTCLPVCASCGRAKVNKMIMEETIDDALARAAEWVYQEMTTPCECMQPVQAGVA